MSSGRSSFAPLLKAGALPIAALLAVLLVVVVSYQAMTQAERALAVRTIDNVDNIGMSAVNAIEKLWIERWSRTALRLSLSPSLRCAMERNDIVCIKKLRGEWDGALRTDENIFFIYYGLSDGSSIHFLPDENPLPPGYDMKTRPWYRAGMSTADALVWTTSYGEAITNRSTITVAVPIRDAFGHTLGLFCIDINSTRLHAILGSVYLPAGAALVLRDESGNRLAAVGASRVIDHGSLVAPQKNEAVEEVFVDGSRYLRKTSSHLDNGWLLTLYVEAPPYGLSTLTARDILFLSLATALIIAILAMWGLSRSLFLARAKTAALADYFSAAAKGGPLVRIFPVRDEYALINSYFNRAMRQVRHYAQERERREKDISELAFLRAQINPHFLHNTLNTIIGMLHEDVDRARGLLIRFSAYLRNSFQFRSEDQFVPLDAEIELTQGWLAIEEARFEHRVRVCFNIQVDRHVRVPAALLQPIVENALHHGILGYRDTGVIDICIEESDRGIEVSVTDDGVGFDFEQVRDRPGRRGIGLDNVNRRLIRLYGTGLVIDSAPGKGTRVAWHIPRATEIRDA